MSSNSSEQEMELELPDETVERNLAYLRGLTGRNNILDRAYAQNGDGCFKKEVDDLFYFYSVPQYIKSLFRVPKLRKGHDERLGELEQVLNHIDLMGPGDVKDYKSFNPNPSVVPFPGMTAITSRERRGIIQTYEGLEGTLDTRPLHARELQEYMREGRIFSIALLSVPTLAFGIYSGSIVDKLLQGKMDPLSIVDMVIAPPPITDCLCICWRI